MSAVLISFIITYYYYYYFIGCVREDAVRSCPHPDEVFASSTNLTCVPAARCPVVPGGEACMTLADGRTVKEGELIEKVGCQEW